QGHAQLVRHAEHDEDLVEDRNNDRPAPNAKHAREEAGQAAGGNQQGRQEYQLAHDDKLRLSFRALPGSRPMIVATRPGSPAARCGYHVCRTIQVKCFIPANPPGHASLLSGVALRAEDISVTASFAPTSTSIERCPVRRTRRPWTQWRTSHEHERAPQRTSERKHARRKAVRSRWAASTSR